MQARIKQHITKTQKILDNISLTEIAKAIGIIQATYERDGRIYVFGNGGSLALANHWVSDFNKTVFSKNLDKYSRRFQAIRLPSTEEELTAWANDVGYDNVFSGPLENHLRNSDIVLAISSSGNSTNVNRAVKMAKEKGAPIISLTGFDGGELIELSDAKIHVPTSKGQYEIVEGVHAVILHLIIKYLRDYFSYLLKSNRIKSK